MIRALRLVSRARPWLVGLFVAQLVVGTLIITQAVALAALVVAVVNGGAWHGPAALMVVTAAARWLAGGLSDWCAVRAATIASEQLRELVVTRRLATADDSSSTGAWTVWASSGIASTEAYFTRYLPAAGAAATLPILTVATIAWWDWISALIVLATLPLLPLFGALIGASTRDKATHQLGALQSLGGHFLDVVRGLPVLVAYGRANVQTQRVAAMTHAYRRASGQTLRLAFASGTALEVVATLSVALVAVSAGLRLADGAMGFLTALTVLLLAPEAYWPVRQLGAEYHAAAQGQAVLGSIDALEPTRAPRLTLPASSPQVIGTHLRLSRGEEVVAEGLDFRAIGPGLVALTGPSGCGKSTLIEAIRGSLLPDDGTVEVGCPGAPRPVHEAIAWSSQHPWVFDGSVADNLRVGQPEASDEQLWHQLNRLGLTSVVAALDGQLNGRVHPGQLSAGERARLATARLAIARRPIVLADEPSAHLDAVSERLVVETLRELAQEALVIVVTHRRDVLAVADQVIVWPTAEQPTPPPPAASTSPAGPSPVAPPPPTESPRWWRSYPVATALATGATASGVALTATSGWLIATASTHPPVLTLMVAIVGVRLFGLARPTLRFAERVTAHDVALRELAEKRTEVFAHLVQLAPAGLPISEGDLLTRVVEDVDAVLDARLRVRLPLVSGTLVAAAAVTVGLLIAVEVGVVLAVGVAVTAAAALWAGQATQQLSSAEATARGRVVTELETSARDAAQWHAWQRDGERVLAVGQAGAEWSAVRRALTVRTGIARHSVPVIQALGVVSVAMVLPAGTSGAVSALALLLSVAVGELAGPWCAAAALRPSVRASAARLSGLLATSPTLPTAGSTPVRTSLGTYAVDAVSVRRGNRQVLSGLFARLAPRETIVVTGPSGSGKTTLTWLLARFLDPHQGAVRFDGVDLREYALEDVRAQVAWVNDNPHLFATSVLENVRLARPTASDEEVEEAFAQVGLAPWLATLENGAHTLIGTGHRDVSGGQRARVALARALLSQRPVWVLDEPTAHLDGPSARRVQAVVEAASAEHSVVWVSHDVPELTVPPRILDLTEGRLTLVDQRTNAPGGALANR